MVQSDASDDDSNLSGAEVVTQNSYSDSAEGVEISDVAQLADDKAQILRSSFPGEKADF